MADITSASKDMPTSKSILSKISDRLSCPF
jgi:hypothetical protein